MRTRALSLVLLAAAAAAVPAPDALDAAQPARKPRKVAFLVGPSTYLHDFDPLKYPAEDVKALAAEFRAAGFDEVVTLTDPPEGKEPATKKNILDRLEKLVAKQPKEADNVRRGDVVVVALSGHGIEFEVPHPEKKGETRWEAFFVPVDGRKTKPDTLVNIGYVVNDVLAPCGGRNLLLVDACRELYQPNKGKGVGAGSVALAGQTAILFSCSGGEQSWEAPEGKAKHGVFTHAVLEVMGDAKKAGQEVFWDDLVAGVTKKMRSPAFKALVPDGKTQTPVLAANQVPATELVAAKAKSEGAPPPEGGAEPKAGEERSVEIADGVKMAFCWVPAGEAQLGSPKAERDLVMRVISEKKEPKYLAAEAEEKRGKFKARGFWLGKYEVTQSEWKAVLGNNPSEFDGKRDNKAKGMNTERLPVENISWNDCQIFLAAANERGAVPKALGKAGPLRLPHEDEWEYAYRGGKGNGWTFYWGNALNGTEANCNGDIPFGPGGKGPYLRRTCAVDDTGGGKYERHPWGLVHMSGNVAEWCDNRVSGEDPYELRASRGGSWAGIAWHCRAAQRGTGTSPGHKSETLGFRVCVPLD